MVDNHQAASVKEFALTIDHVKQMSILESAILIKILTVEVNALIISMSLFKVVSWKQEISVAIHLDQSIAKHVDQVGCAVVSTTSGPRISDFCGEHK